jgi:hypothetical protein
MPVKLPPGRLRLGTSPIRTGVHAGTEHYRRMTKSPNENKIPITPAITRSNYHPLGRAAAPWFQPRC